MTERLILREFHVDDLAAVFSYKSNAENLSYMISPPKDEKGIKEDIERSIREQGKSPRTVYDFAVTLKTTGVLIGDCGIYPYQQNGWSEAALEWMLHKDYRRQGYGMEVALALLKFGFDELQIHRIYATCDADNLASARIMEKCRMRREGYYKESRPGRIGIKDRYYDEVLYAMLRAEWACV